ncbi:MAG TPA: cation:dicarboxylase symporter family transporter, partial [Atopostipes sp.]|nr:cation:dicarboxylase symporter family transporter [Atopostipes sp.]
MNQWTKSSGDPMFLNIVKQLNTVTLNIILTVMKIAPLGIFALLADVAGTIGLRVIAPMIQYLGILLVGVLLFMTF